MSGNHSNDYQSYLNHMERKHAELNGRLQHLRQMFQQGNHDAAATEQLSRELHDFDNELTRQFSEEEAGGCVEEAVCRRPSLAHEVSVIEQQHRELKAQLAALMAEVEHGDQQSEADFEKFSEAVEHNESVESLVLQRGFSASDDADA